MGDIFGDIFGDLFGGGSKADANGPMKGAKTRKLSLAVRRNWRSY